MIKNVRIRQVHTDSLSCEPILRRTESGELLCVCQCDGTCDLRPENRAYVFHSNDNGETWSEGEKIYPEDGQAVYCTEVSVDGNEITAYLSVHNGSLFNWKCLMMKSFDNGYTWEDFGAPPHFEGYTLIRSRIRTSKNDIVIPYQHYTVTEEQKERLEKDNTIERKGLWHTGAKYCESGVLISNDNGESYERYTAAKTETTMKDIIWSEPTVVELSDGRLAMLMRKDGSGWLWYTESSDGGKTWSETIKTDIPNPSNKPKLIKIDDGRIALLHTPSSTIGQRFPLSLWISTDDMKTWEFKTALTNFPGCYSYCGGFYENGHIMFTVEHNRHTVLLFDVELKK